MRFPDSGRDPAEDFHNEHIPGAYFFDLDKISDQKSNLPHMLPEAYEFSRAMRKIGLKNSSHVIIYDTGGVRAAARARWMFLVFGHDQVSILDGGMGRWLSLGFPTVSGEAPETATYYTATGFRAHMVADAEDVMAAIRAGNTYVLDARGPGRFSGREPEPRPGTKSSSIPTNVMKRRWRMPRLGCRS